MFRQPRVYLQENSETLVNHHYTTLSGNQNQSINVWGKYDLFLKFTNPWGEFTQKLRLKIKVILSSNLFLPSPKQKCLVLLQPRCHGVGSPGNQDQGFQMGSYRAM